MNDHDPVQSSALILDAILTAVEELCGDKSEAVIDRAQEILAEGRDEVGKEDIH